MSIYAYSPHDAAQFILGFGLLPVIGGPITKPGGWLSTAQEIRTLSDFVKYKYPPWGVIVRPGAGKDVLVSYDARGLLHVIEVSKEPIVSSVIQAVVEAPSFGAVVVDRTKEVIDASGSIAKQAAYTTTQALANLSGSIERAIPDPKATFDKLVVFAGVALVVYVALVSARKSS